MSKRQILLAEDNEDQAIITQEAFRQSGWKQELQRVADGAELMAYLDGKDQFADRKKFPYPTLLLLDLWMPNVNGFESLKWIRAQPRHRTLLVFVLTFENDEDLVRKVYDLGANCLISKPRDFEEMARFASHLKTYLGLIQVPPSPEI